MSDVVTVWQMDDEDGAKHDDDDGDGSDAEQRADQYRNAAGELSQSDQITHSDRHVHERRETLRAWATEHPEQDGAAVEDKGQRTSDAHDKELEIQFACATRQPVKCAH